MAAVVVVGVVPGDVVLTTVLDVTAVFATWVPATVATVEPELLFEPPQAASVAIAQITAKVLQDPREIL